MTRKMGDATHADAHILATVPGLQLVAGYDTGSPDIDWTAADIALFQALYSGIIVLMIDQGFTGSPNLTANIRDVEFGAWAPGQAVNKTGWNVERPTIYCTLRETGYGLLTNPGVLADGWKGDLWLSIPNWQPGQALPSTPGCNIVAVQNNFDNPAYDLSVVLDPTWPNLPEEDMKIITIDRNSVPTGVNWPGSWLLKSDGSVEWLNSPRYLALLHAGITEVPNYAYADWQALAGVQ